MGCHLAQMQSMEQGLTHLPSPTLLGDLVQFVLLSWVLTKSSIGIPEAVTVFLPSLKWRAAGTIT